jgi:hypothetical protein
LTIAFQDACSRAANNTAVITKPDNYPPSIPGTGLDHSHRSDTLTQRKAEAIWVQELWVDSVGFDAAGFDPGNRQIISLFQSIDIS